MNTSSFVNSLKKIQNEVNTAKVKHELKETQFNMKAGYSKANKQTSFDSPIVEQSDPYFPDIRLVNRYMSRDELNDAIPSNSDCLTLTGLFKQVSPPEFKRPFNSSPNFVVFAIVATRSETKTSAQNNKYVTMTLCDLKYDITLALHGKAHEKYWKIQPGTLIALFSPQFWISKTENTRTLNLSVNKLNCILEIGQAADIGQCEATTTTSKHNKRCKNWVDVRKTHYCDYHVEQKATKTKRPEFSAQSAKVWDPQSVGKYTSSRMAVYKGGSVSWKQGLQIDKQAPKIRNSHAPVFGGFPDAPIGRVFTSESTKNSSKFETSLGDVAQRKIKDKRMLERATEDAALRKSLNKKPAIGKVVKEPPRSEPSSKTAFDLRRLGFSRIRSSASIDMPKVALNKHYSDSDSELEIV